MEIILLLVLAIIMIAISILGSEYQIVGFIGGIGLVMIAFAVQSSGIEIVTGVTITAVNATTDTVVTNYSPIETVFSGIDYLATLITIVLGGSGILLALYTALK